MPQSRYDLGHLTMDTKGSATYTVACDHETRDVALLGACDATYVHHALVTTRIGVVK